MSSGGREAEVVWYGLFFLRVRTERDWESVDDAPFRCGYGDLSLRMLEAAERIGATITNYDPVRQYFLFDEKGEAVPYRGGKGE